MKPQLDPFTLLGQHPSDYLRNDMGAAFEAHLEDYVGELIMEQKRLKSEALFRNPFGDLAKSSAGIAARDDDLDRAFGPNRDDRSRF
jgi:hypothetical protein